MENPFLVLDQRLTILEQGQNKILELLGEKRQPPAANEDELLDIPAVATLTHSSVAAIRGWVRREEIAVYKPGRRILIRRGDAMAKVFNAKRKSRLELQQTAQSFLARRGRPKK